ncbi:MAG TPA: heme-binding protein [Candidatus Methanoperedens sp.]
MVDKMRDKIKTLAILSVITLAMFAGYATGKELTTSYVKESITSGLTEKMMDAAENAAGKELTASYVKKSITSELSEKMIDAAETKAKEIKVPMVIAIVDESGNLKAFRRMDGAPLLSIDIAIDKGYTAAGFGLPTHEWYNLIKDDGPLLIGIPKVPRIIVFGGGYPIKEDNEIIGAIGVSGGHYTQDMVVAEAALEILK